MNKTKSTMTMKIVQNFTWKQVKTIEQWIENNLKTLLKNKAQVHVSIDHKNS
jgi:hypothetical protein